MLEGAHLRILPNSMFGFAKKKGRNHYICLLCDRSAYCINQMCPLKEQCAPFHGGRGRKIIQPGMAASGGYWLACAGKEIYASRCSVVGSLGVIHMGLGVVALMEKLGLESRVITSGENKDFLNPTRPLREADVEVMKRVLSEVHGHFINHVKTSRGDRLQGTDTELFNGAVWSSGDALKLGLIDGVQSMEEYIEKKWGNEVKVVRHRSKFEELAEKFGAANAGGDLTNIANLLQVWEQRLKMH